MRKLTALAIALLLGTLTASVVSAQSGKSRHQNGVTPQQGQDVVDFLYFFLGGAEETDASARARMKQRLRDGKERTRNRPSQQRLDTPPFKDDASADGE